MKKLFFATVLTVSVIAASAQINQGQWLVGGSANFTSSKQGDSKWTDITFSPNAGYFFINNFAGGLRLNVASEKESGSDASTLFTAAPFVRYYFLPSAQKVNIFADAQYGFGSGKQGGESASINEYQIAAGPAVFLSPNTALEFTVFYESMGGKYFEGLGSDRQNSFGVNIGFQIHLGDGGGKKK